MNTQELKQQVHKEFVKDKIQQIFKFLEIADVSKWQGMNVFEAGDSDSLYGILETAFSQVIDRTVQHEQERIVGIMNKIRCRSNVADDKSEDYWLDYEELLALITNKSDINNDKK